MLASLGMLAQAGAAAGPGPASVPDNFAPNSPINIAPVGVNFGEIIKGYDQGGVTNGGSGANMPSRYAQQYINGNNNVPTESAEQTNQINVIVWGGVAAVLGLGAFFIARRG